jgi:proteasome lid subunit RPN8/RPN11
VTSRSSADAAPPRGVHLPRAIRDALIADLRAARPNEGCGLIAGDASPFRGGAALAWLATRNRLASPYRFEVDPDDLLRAQLAIDDAGQVVWAVVHSHVASEPRPSPTDIRAAVHPEALHLVVSFTSDPPGLRAWRITADADVTEVPIIETGTPS